jgi:hypothetical protein
MSFHHSDMVQTKTWLELIDVDTNTWHAMRSVKEWSIDGVHKHGQSKKAMASLAVLISWKFWKERNPRVFRNEASTSDMVVTKIKKEVAMWSLAGAKALSNVMPRE